jgi:hypothetical protein
MKLKIKFTASGEIINLNFPNTPRLSDIFEYKQSYFMVVDYDGEFVHVV